MAEKLKDVLDVAGMLAAGEGECGVIAAAAEGLATATLSRPPLQYKDCSDELWCEYRYHDCQGVARAYRIEAPLRMYYYKGCTSHRVLDAEGLVHIVPAISQGGCVRVYKPKDVVVPAVG